MTGSNTTNELTESQPRRGNPSWRRGGPSPNPTGRPKDHLAARLRELVDVDEIVAYLLEVASTRFAKATDRLKAIELIADRAWGKPQSNLDVSVTARASSLPAGWDALSQAERVAWLDSVETERMLGSGS